MMPKSSSYLMVKIVESETDVWTLASKIGVSAKIIWDILSEKSLGTSEIWLQLADELGLEKHRPRFFSANWQEALQELTEHGNRPCWIAWMELPTHDVLPVEWSLKPIREDNVFKVCRSDLKTALEVIDMMYSDGTFWTEEIAASDEKM